MTKIVPINETKATQWFDGEKYLSSVMRENLSVFSKEFDLVGESVLYLLPDCRHLAREKFLHKEALSEILDYCLDISNTVKLNDESLGLFFCEYIEHTFCELFKTRFKAFVEGKSREEIQVILLKEVGNLNGASAKRLAMQKWGGRY